MALHDPRTSAQPRRQLFPWRLRSKERRNALGLNGSEVGTRPVRETGQVAFEQEKQGGWRTSWGIHTA